MPPASIKVTSDIGGVINTKLAVSTLTTRLMPLAMVPRRSLEVSTWPIENRLTPVRVRIGANGARNGSVKQAMAIPNAISAKQYLMIFFIFFESVMFANEIRVTSSIVPFSIIFLLMWYFSYILSKLFRAAIFFPL